MINYDRKGELDNGKTYSRILTWIMKQDPETGGRATHFGMIGYKATFPDCLVEMRVPEKAEEQFSTVWTLDFQIGMFKCLKNTQKTMRTTANPV